MNSLSVCFIIEKAVLRRVELLHLSGGAKVPDAPCGVGTLAVALM